MIEWAFGILTTLTLGSYAYTHREADKAAKKEDLAELKEDVKYLRNRLDAVHDKIVGKK